MQPIHNKSRVAMALVLGILCTTLFSFSGRWGADSFEIYLNHKLVLKQYVSQKEGTKSFQLDKSSYNDQVDIYYSHCGRIGKGRSITIKDEHNSTLKEFHFPDVTGSNSAMTFKVKDILALQKNNGSGKLNLYYSAQEPSLGMLLATIVLGNNGKTGP